MQKLRTVLHSRCPHRQTARSWLYLRSSAKSAVKPQSLARLPLHLISSPQPLSHNPRATLKIEYRVHIFHPWWLTLEDLNLEHLWVVYPGTLRYPITENITALSVQEVGSIVLGAG